MTATIERSTMPRTGDALVQDHYGYDEWHAALLPLGAAGGIEDAYYVESGDPVQKYGVYVEWDPDEACPPVSYGVRLHVPRLGTSAIEGADTQEALIRGAVRAAAQALGLDGGAPHRGINIEAMIRDLELHEGQMTQRERHLCTTLLYGLRAAGVLAANDGPSDGRPR